MHQVNWLVRVDLVVAATDRSACVHLVVTQVVTVWRKILAYMPVHRMYNELDTHKRRIGASLSKRPYKATEMHWLYMCAHRSPVHPLLHVSNGDVSINLKLRWWWWWEGGGGGGKKNREKEGEGRGADGKGRFSCLNMSRKLLSLENGSYRLSLRSFVLESRPKSSLNNRFPRLV